MVPEVAPEVVPEGSERSKIFKILKKFGFFSFQYRKSNSETKRNPNESNPEAKTRKKNRKRENGKNGMKTKKRRNGRKGERRKR